jgi:hypothetical protein
MRMRKLIMVSGIFVLGITAFLATQTSFAQNLPPGNIGGLPGQLMNCKTDLRNCSSSLATSSSNLSACTANLSSCTANLQSSQSNLSSCTANLQSTQSELSSCNELVYNNMFVDEGDGTFIDLRYRLQWTTKTGFDDGRGEVSDIRCPHRFACPDPNDIRNIYTIEEATTVYLAALNDMAGGGQHCFAGHCDWRLPEIWELWTFYHLWVPGKQYHENCFRLMMSNTVDGLTGRYGISLPFGVRPTGPDDLYFHVWAVRGGW